MIHNTARVDSIRIRTKIALERVSQLEAAKGELPELKLVRNQLGDIEDFCSQLERETRTPQQETARLDFTEGMLRLWIAEMDRIDERFKRFGSAQAGGAH